MSSLAEVDIFVQGESAPIGRLLISEKSDYIARYSIELKLSDGRSGKATIGAQLGDLTLKVPTGVVSLAVTSDDYETLFLAVRDSMDRRYSDFEAGMLIAGAQDPVYRVDHISGAGETELLDFGWEDSEELADKVLAGLARIP